MTENRQTTWAQFKRNWLYWIALIPAGVLFLVWQCVVGLFAAVIATGNTAFLMFERFEYWACEVPYGYYRGDPRTKSLKRYWLQCFHNVGSDV